MLLIIKDSCKSVSPFVNQQHRFEDQLIISHIQMLLDTSAAARLLLKTLRLKEKLLMIRPLLKCFQLFSIIVLSFFVFCTNWNSSRTLYPKKPILLSYKLSFGFRLLVNLTKPVECLGHGALPDHPTNTDLPWYWDVEKMLRDTKIACSTAACPERIFSEIERIMDDVSPNTPPLPHMSILQQKYRKSLKMKEQ